MIFNGFITICGVLLGVMREDLEENILWGVLCVALAKLAKLALSSLIGSSPKLPSGV